MANVVLGAFSHKNQADKAIDTLESNGYNVKDISIIMRNEKGETVVKESTGESVTDGALSGATTGGVIGAVAGLLVGIGAIAIPGIGGLMIGGPVAAALGLTGAAASTVSGAVTGALAGGLIGGLVGLGIPEDEARIYEERVRQGNVLLFVPITNNEPEDRVRTILAENGAEEVRSFALHV